MGAKVLVVDDDPTISRLIKRYLEEHAYSVLVTDNGSDALLLAKEGQPDLVLADVQLPALNGHQLCRILRQETATQSIPLILMSGEKIDEKNVLAGFEGGADDYMAKPFSLPILLARIEAVLRRYQDNASKSNALKKYGMQLDPAGRTVKINKKPINLTRKEFDLLTLLISKPGRVLSTSYLLETVWGYDLSDYNDPGTVEVHISHLRKKLGSKIAKHIVNVTGNGYKFTA